MNFPSGFGSATTVLAALAGRLRKPAMAVLAALGLSTGALAVATPAQAQSFSISIGSGYGSHGFRAGPPRGHYGFERPAYGYAPVVGYRDHGHVGRPFRDERHWRGRHAYAPACTVRHVRYWDGYGWVVERRRFCR